MTKEFLTWLESHPANSSEVLEPEKGFKIIERPISHCAQGSFCLSCQFCDCCWAGIIESSRMFCGAFFIQVPEDMQVE